jgi:hypothetical protein
MRYEDHPHNQLRYHPWALQGGISSGSATLRTCLKFSLNLTADLRWNQELR